MRQLGMMSSSRLACLFSAVALAACGGGNDSDAGKSLFGVPAPAPSAAPAPSPVPAPVPGQQVGVAGFWSGSTTTGFAFQVLVTPSGETWGFYGPQGQAWGALHGFMTAGDSAFSGNGTDYYIRGGVVSTASFTGTYTARTAIAGSYTGSNPGSFSGAYLASYDTPASLANAAGTWHLKTLSGAGTVTTTVQVGPSGAVTGNNGICALTGTATPAPDGKGYFTLATSFSGPTCEFNGRSLSGVAVIFAGSGAPQLGVAALLPDGSNGFIGIGSR